MIVDKFEGWILETVGSYWVVKIIKGKVNVLVSLLRRKIWYNKESDLFNVVWLRLDCI